MPGRLRGWWRRREAPVRPDPAPPEPPFDPARVAVARHPERLADLSRDAIRALITALDARSEEVGCAIFGDGTAFDRAVVIFAGNMERFHMLAAARYIPGLVIYVQDVRSWWYQGSGPLPDLRAFCRHFLAGEIGSVPALFFGQSSGAYAALVASTFFRGSTVVACAPQTFPDAGPKGRFHFVGINVHATPHDILDLRTLLKGSPDPDASRTVVIAASETGNPASSHFWMDYLHALHLANLDDVSISIVGSDSHAIVHGRVELFAEHLRELTLDLPSPVERRIAMTREFLARTFAKG